MKDDEIWPKNVKDKIRNEVFNDIKLSPVNIFNLFKG